MVGRAGRPLLRIACGDLSKDRRKHRPDRTPLRTDRRGVIWIQSRTAHPLLPHRIRPDHSNRQNPPRTDGPRKPFRRVTTAQHRRRRSRVPCGDDCFIPKRLFFKTLDERLRRLERRDGMRRHEDGRVARDVAGFLRGSLTAHEAAETPEIDVLSAYLGCTNPLQQCLDDTCDHFTLQTRLSGNLLDDLCFCHKCCILMFVIFAKIAIFSSTGNSVSTFFPGCISNSTQE